MRNINAVGKSVPRCNMHGDAARPCAVRDGDGRRRGGCCGAMDARAIASRLFGRGCIAAFTQLPVDTVHHGGKCVMATCTLSIVIALLLGRRATRRVRFTEWMRRRILCRGSFYWKFSAAHFWISAIFPFARA